MDTGEGKEVWRGQMVSWPSAESWSSAGGDDASKLWSKDSLGKRFWRALSWAAMRAMVRWAAVKSASSLSFSAWSSSTSCRLRSRELWAARRLRFTRSMRRCSFSSSVLARLRGGRFVLGSGSTWPHDFRFLTDLGSEEPGVDGCEVGGSGGVEKGTARSSILMVVELGSTVGGGVSWCAEIMAGVVMVCANS